ncbi:hypothetical protein V493_02158 [Pseudogymnoascus sp. VKM F-4281 (FW-2241)]|nr:hypothetical protein V493_02158 [Pseudogymnoascus sp. VKM F-4281 (FW-2241)]
MIIPAATVVPRTRRRMRRGARKRHGGLARKVDPREEYREGACLAYDTSFLPLSATFPTHPQSLERSWLAWMAHEVRREEEEEQCRLFGGDADDDAQALRALGILYDSIRDEESSAPTPASGVFTNGNNGDNTKDKDKDNFPPLPSGLSSAVSNPTIPKTTKTTRRHNSRHTPLTVPTPPLLQSHLLDDSEILRLTTLQSPEPAEEREQTHQSLPTQTSFPTQFPVPLHVPVPGPVDHNDSPAPTAPTTTTKATDPSWTLIPQDPDWVLLEDDS